MTQLGFIGQWRLIEVFYSKRIEKADRRVIKVHCIFPLPARHVVGPVWLRSGPRDLVGGPGSARWGHFIKGLQSYAREGVSSRYTGDTLSLHPILSSFWST